MTNLDQAFIKAYRQQSADTTPDERIPLSEALGLSDSETSIAAGTSSWIQQQAAPSTVPAPHVEFPSNALDSKSAQPESAVEPFRPLLEVDEFTLPPLCRELCQTASQELNLLADALAYESSHGMDVLAIDGCTAGEGTTTLVLCLADCLSKLKIKVAVVDANLRDPQLATRLNLAPEAGWESVLREELPLDEVVIESCSDSMAVLPMREPVSSAESVAENASRMASDIRTLRSSFDLVLVDMPPLENQAMVDGLLSGRFLDQVDAILFTQNVRSTSDDRLAELQERLQSASVKQAGIVQTFVPAA